MISNLNTSYESKHNILDRDSLDPLIRESWYTRHPYDMHAKKDNSWTVRSLYYKHNPLDDDNLNDPDVYIKRLHRGKITNKLTILQGVFIRKINSLKMFLAGI